MSPFLFSALFSTRARVKIGDDVIAVPGADGPDYYRICHAHEWASREHVLLRDVPHCPACELEDTKGAARARYLRLTEEA